MGNGVEAVAEAEKTQENADCCLGAVIDFLCARAKQLIMMMMILLLLMMTMLRWRFFFVRGRGEKGA